MDMTGLLAAVLDWASGIRAELEAINDRLEKIMTEDAAIQAVTADESAQLATITSALASIATTVGELVADITSNPNAVQPSTVAALQAVQGQLDALATTATQQAAAEAAEVPPATS